MAHVLVGYRKQFINNFDFPTWACAAGFNNNNNYSGAALLFLVASLLGHLNVYKINIQGDYNNFKNRYIFEAITLFITIVFQF